jgi:hypothetical protein
MLWCHMFSSIFDMETACNNQESLKVNRCHDVTVQQLCPNVGVVTCACLLQQSCHPTCIRQALADHRQV